MDTIILSIKPEFTKKILLNEKKYEFRRCVCKKSINKIYIYETTPTKLITGEAEVIAVLNDKLEELWDLTKSKGGISKEYFLKYFKGKTKGYAYQLGKVIKYSKPKKLEDFGIKYPPQSFVYIK